MFYIMVRDNCTPKRFTRVIKKFWDIIMKVTPRYICNFDDDFTDLVVVSVKSAVKANISMEAYQFYLHQSPSSEVNYRKDLVCNMFSKNFILSAWKFKECFGLKQASDCYYKLVTKNLTTIFWWYSEANE